MFLQHFGSTWRWNLDVFDSVSDRYAAQKTGRWPRLYTEKLEQELTRCSLEIQSANTAAPSDLHCLQTQQKAQSPTASAAAGQRHIQLTGRDLDLTTRFQLDPCDLFSSSTNNWIRHRKNNQCLLSCFLKLVYHSSTSEETDGKSDTIQKTSLPWFKWQNVWDEMFYWVEDSRNHIRTNLWYVWVQTKS